MRRTIHIALLSSLSTVAGHAATVVAPVSVTSSIPGDAGSSANYLLVDNAGFSAPSLQDLGGAARTLPTGTDLTIALDTYHARGGGAHAESWTKGTGDGNPVFTFDLSGGGDVAIRSIILWQYGNNGGGATNVGNSTRSFSLIFHTEAEGNVIDFGSEVIEFTNIMNPITGQTTLDNVAQHYGFGAEQNARYVGLRIDSNYLPPADPTITAGGDRYGLGEVRFAIPEPSALLLGGLGLIGFLRRRR